MPAKNMDGEKASMRKDIRILLAQLDWLLECTGESLDDEDAVLVEQIREDYK